MTGRNYPVIRHDPSRIVTPFATRYGSGILDMSEQGENDLLMRKRKGQKSVAKFRYKIISPQARFSSYTVTPHLFSRFSAQSSSSLCHGSGALCCGYPVVGARPKSICGGYFFPILS